MKFNLIPVHLIEFVRFLRGQCNKGGSYNSLHSSILHFRTVSIGKNLHAVIRNQSTWKLLQQQVLRYSDCFPLSVPIIYDHSSVPSSAFHSLHTPIDRSYHLNGNTLGDAMDGKDAVVGHNWAHSTVTMMMMRVTQSTTPLLDPDRRSIRPNSFHFSSFSPTTDAQLESNNELCNWTRNCCSLALTIQQIPRCTALRFRWVRLVDGGLILEKDRKKVCSEWLGWVARIKIQFSQS